jgi:hypothetical protein
MHAGMRELLEPIQRSPLLEGRGSCPFLRKKEKVMVLWVSKYVASRNLTMRESVSLN